VSAKIRLGFDSIDAVHENAEQIFKAGANWLTIHARTKTQGYRPPVFWKKIAEINEISPIPIIANGDIWSIDDFKICQDLTGCRHFMLGRGVLANPFLSCQIAKELGLPLTDIQRNWAEKKSPSSEDWIELLAELARLATEREGTDKYAILRLKQWLSFRNMKYPTPCFQQIKLLQEISSFYDLISGNSHLAFDSVDQQDSSRRLDVALQSSL
jgi:tRNA-dihydrouridine synthase C